MADDTPKVSPCLNPKIVYFVNFDHFLQYRSNSLENMLELMNESHILVLENYQDWEINEQVQFKYEMERLTYEANTKKKNEE